MIKKNNLYTETGFRTTGTHTNSEYLSFGVWAKDSYWGFWQEDESALNPSNAHTAFIAGGRNKSLPNPITGTWSGLAVGKHKLFDEVRVGRSEVVVRLGPTENNVDVSITGLHFSGPGLAVNQERYDIGVTLSWKGLKLTDTGFFHDPRRFGMRDNLDDVFEAVVPVGGERYSDTAGTIRGQFYGRNGDEVTGVFDKNDVEGSFGAYRKR